MNEDLIAYFIKRTDMNIEEINLSIEKIREKLDRLTNFKFLSLGIVMGVSSFCSIAVTLLTLYLTKK
jgi:hypothetical protein